MIADYAEAFAERRLVASNTSNVCAIGGRLWIGSEVNQRRADRRHDPGPVDEVDPMASVPTVPPVLTNANG